MYTNAAAVRDYIGENGAGNDALITALIARAQAAIDTYTGRTFEAASATRYFDVPDGPELYTDDFVTLTAITNGNGDTINTANVRLLPTNATPKYAIRHKVSTGASWESDGGDRLGVIAITATWGYSEAAPDDVVQACTRWAAYMYRQRDAQVFDTIAQPGEGVITIPQGMPADVKVLLERYIRAVIV